MKSIMKILAKEIRRIRILIKVMERCTGVGHIVSYKILEVEILKRILGLMIKKELDKSSDSD